MSFNATFFLSAHAYAQATGMPNPVLYVYPDGGYTGSVNFQIPNGVSLDKQVKIAESIFRGAKAFRDAVVADVHRQRTAEDELAEARAEIARLKADAEDGAS
ncbi:hypothetical protein [Actinacidiphila sp. ITFR-21]|uniref:hypothetical protein n=1 Tax=Actinacidiphila sp. ITFR-21 TaxID=3075199 RepID=UPI00288C47B2|nr:hypothetical protein [Streptomyces sp. ITFR-21]WNI15541.1 hypothetical protein RLT57_08395 [Streptomyces sp. ITFR-21]